MIPVRVSYRRSGNGWSYVVLAASGALQWLGDGWSAGTKRDAQQSFRAQALVNGWIERDERLRGAA